MSLAPGTKLGSYEIVEPIGAGGMGEVYRARDTRLDRTVAIKVLPPELAESAERKERFRREARAISQLNHPHICTLHDVGEDGGVDFIVMEYLEGTTLADLLERGPLPLDKALEYGIQIADGLDAAHRERVVHRDLKPANIIITSAGIKLLDFGLAKLVEGELDDGASDAPTKHQDLTKEQSILGTLQYMAPEQLESKPVDHRTDIFAFGAVLYEMTTGKKAFEGESQASLITAIMSATPRPVTDVVTVAPPSLDHVVAKSLSKEKERRWQSARDLMTELQWISEGGGVAEPRATTSVSGRPWKLAAVGACLLAAALGWLVLHRAPVTEATIRFSIPIQSMSDVEVALSPNGRLLAYTESGALWIRRLDAIEAESVPGTAIVESPFWSPDSRYVGFFEQGKLQKVDLVDGVDGPVVTLCNAARAHGGTWSHGGTIVFGSGDGPLLAVDASGGEPVAVTRLDAELEENIHRSPHFLPDGRHFLYVGSRSTAANTGLFVGSLDSVEMRRFITDADSNGLYADPGLLLFARDGNFLAQEFDTEALELKGEPAIFVQDVQVYGSYLAVASVSTTGVVAHRHALQDRHIAWFDRSGRELSVVTAPDAYNRVQLSDDDATAALNVSSTRGDIQVLDLGRGTASRFRDQPFLQGHPILSPDGRQVVFAANPDGLEDLYARASNGTGEMELIHASSIPHKHPSDWSRDGRFILFDTNNGLWVLPVSDDEEPYSLKSSPRVIAGAVFSPDVRWVAYTSDESGRFEVYLQDFPDGNERWQISTNGGSQPRWRADGRELFYLDLDSELMALDFDVDSGGEPVFGLPVELFQTRVLQNERHLYDVAADGQRFLMSALAGDPPPIVVVVNGLDELRRSGEID